MADTHKPVPDYSGRFGRAVDKFFQNIQPAKWFLRMNWFVHVDPSLFQPRWKSKIMGANITPETAGDCLWLRSERQTFHRLARTGAVVLTFHSYLEKLKNIICTQELASQFSGLLRNMPYETQKYRHMEIVLPALLIWLERACEDPSGLTR
ncbi:MAG: heme-dependent oxidative N-demethylase subunit alpha family protein, partial [Pseudolabrys sp.]